MKLTVGRLIDHITFARILLAQYYRDSVVFTITAKIAEKKRKNVRALQNFTTG